MDDIVDFLGWEVKLVVNGWIMFFGLCCVILVLCGEVEKW